MEIDNYIFDKIYKLKSLIQIAAKNLEEKVLMHQCKSQICNFLLDVIDFQKAVI